MGVNLAWTPPADEALVLWNGRRDSARDLIAFKLVFEFSRRHVEFDRQSPAHEDRCRRLGSSRYRSLKQVSEIREGPFLAV
jgi:hypothetical protein